MDDTDKATIETLQGEWKASDALEGGYKAYRAKSAAIKESERPSDVNSDSSETLDISVAE